MCLNQPSLTHHGQSSLKQYVDFPVLFHVHKNHGNTSIILTSEADNDAQEPNDIQNARQSADKTT